MDGRAIVAGQTLIILIGALRLDAARIAAEIGWVRERLAQDIELVLVWPPWVTLRARALRADLSSPHMYVDCRGDFLRLVQPGGRSVALLVNPNTECVARITGADPVFTAHESRIDVPARGKDRTIDLGDVCH